MRKKQDDLWRAIEVEGTGDVLILSKATAVKTKQNMIHLDQLPDGTWRLIYNGDMIPDFSVVEGLKIIREDCLKELEEENRDE